MPSEFAESPDGELFVTDGYGPVLAWDGFDPQMRLAGVPAPTTKPTLSNVGRGSIVGSRRVFVRFLDNQGHAGNPSPLSDAIDALSSGGTVTGASDAVPCVITTSAPHGMTSGATVKIEGVRGNTGVNGSWIAVVLSPTMFSLTGSAGSGTYTGGGEWSSGVASLTVTNVATSSDTRAVRRQILRNTDGQFRTYYVEVDTIDKSTTTFALSMTDDQLAAQESVALIGADAEDLASIRGEPPQDKPFMTYHQGRMFAAGSIEYAEGAVSVTTGSVSVTGIGTEWLSASVGRFLYIRGADRAYEIATVNPVNQTLTLTQPYTGPSAAYATYGMVSAPAERQLVWFSEPGEPHAWSPLNAIALPEDGDEVTGLMSKGSFLYILKRRHIYRLTFLDDPQQTTGGAIFLAAQRGCVNSRSFAIAGETAYLLDEQGFWRFDGPGEDGSISTPIQPLLRTGELERINFAAARYFHCEVDFSTETIRWYVAMSGTYMPRHAVCYSYILDRWWAEEYYLPIASSCRGKLARSPSLGTWGPGGEQLFLGSHHRRVLAWGASTLDGVNPDSGTLLGAVTSAGPRSLTLAFTPPPGLANVAVVVTEGRGVGQWRRIVSQSGSVLKLDRAWSVQPDALSRVQIGGVFWKWKSGWFRWADEESHNPRRIEMQFEPNADQLFYLERFRDRRDTPVLAGASASDDGVTTIAQSGRTRVDCGKPSGFAQSRLEGMRDTTAGGPRLVAVRLSGTTGAVPLRIYQVTIDGASGGQPDG